MTTELHSVNENYIADEAATLLEEAARTIRERAKSYNTNDINFEDYMILGVEQAVAMTVESVVRAWNGDHADKCIDAVSYQALTMALLKAGVPQSRFSPIFNRFMPELFKAMKKHDSNGHPSVEERDHPSDGNPHEYYSPISTGMCKQCRQVTDISEKELLCGSCQRDKNDAELDKLNRTVHPPLVGGISGI